MTMTATESTSRVRMTVGVVISTPSTRRELAGGSRRPSRRRERELAGTRRGTLVGPDGATGGPPGATGTVRLDGAPRVRPGTGPAGGPEEAGGDCVLRAIGEGAALVESEASVPAGP